MPIATLPSSGQQTDPIVAVVLQRNEIRTYANRRGTGELFSVLLADETAEIKGCFFGKSLVTAWELCKAGSTVKIIGGYVAPADSRYNLASNPFEIKIDMERNGSVAEATEVIDVSPKFNFRRFSDLVQVGTRGVIVDVIGVLLSIETPTDIQTSKGATRKATVTLADDSATTISCTFWGTSANQVDEWTVGSVLAMKGAKTSDFGVMTLVGTTALCCYNPRVPDTEKLLAWNESRQGGGDNLLPLSVLASQKSDQSGDEIRIHVPDNIKRVCIRKGSLERVVFLDQA